MCQRKKIQPTWIMAFFCKVLGIIQSSPGPSDLSNRRSASDNIQPPPPGALHPRAVHTPSLTWIGKSHQAGWSGSAPSPSQQAPFPNLWMDPRVFEDPKNEYPMHFQPGIFHPAAVPRSFEVWDLLLFRMVSDAVHISQPNSLLLDEFAQDL